MSPSPLRVLLVEDTDDLRVLYSRVLRRQGFQVSEACNGLEALSRLDDLNPDLVLTDIMMPVLDGIELIRRIRSIPELEETPVVAITGSGNEIEQRARDAGAVDVLAKPLKLPELLERLAPYQPSGRRGWRRGSGDRPWRPEPAGESASVRGSFDGPVR